MGGLPFSLRLALLDKAAFANGGNTYKGVIQMLHYAIVFLVVAIIAAVLGFGVIAGTAAWIAKILFVVFLILAVIAFVRRKAL